MSEFWPTNTPLENLPDSIARVAETAANEMRELIMSRSLSVATKPDGTILTNADILVDEYFRKAFGADPRIDIRSEEGLHAPIKRRALIAIHLDPNDGSDNLAQAYESWRATPRARQGSPPTSLVTISAGGVHRHEMTPRWGVIYGPLFPGGPRRYTTQNGRARREIQGKVEQLKAPAEADGNAVIMSANSAKKYGAPLVKAGFEIVIGEEGKYGGAGIANILQVIDPELAALCHPNLRNKIVGNVMGGYDWDVAGAIPLFTLAGAAVSGLKGERRTVGEGMRGSIFATSQDILEKLSAVTKQF